MASREAPAPSRKARRLTSTQSHHKARRARAQASIPGGLRRVQTLQALLPVAIEDHVAALAGDSELPADARHGVPVQQTGDKTEAH